MPIIQSACRLVKDNDLWSIEVFFKTCKSLLRLNREYSAIGYDAMTAWVAVVFARYVMLAYLNRVQTDERTLGELFFRSCEELADITLQEAFQLLMKVFAEYVLEKKRLAEEDLEALFETFLLALPAPLKNRLLRCA